MKKYFIIFVLFFFLLVFSGCSSTGDYTNQVLTEKKQTQHLVLIVLDGLGGGYIPHSNMPILKLMMANGASTLNTKNIKPSMTWANLPAIFYGAPPDKHLEEAFPSIFSIINDKTAAFYYEWDYLDKINLNQNTQKFIIDSSFSSALIAASFIKENKPLFTAVVFEEPDITGHKNNFGSSEYYRTLTMLDYNIKVIIKAVIEAGMLENTVFVITSDHGGIFKDHSLNFKISRRIPIIITGNGIKKNYIIRGRTSILDVAPTMAAILGLEIPEQWTGKPLLDIFE